MNNFITPNIDYNEICKPIKYPYVKKIYNSDLFEQYDSTIGSRTIFGRLDFIKNYKRIHDYAILDIPEANQEVIITWGVSFDECYINIINKNYKPLCLVNCLNYGEPNTAIYDIKIFLEKLNRKCIKHDIPIIGGGVSLYNCSDKVNIKPTPQLVMIGILDKIIQV